MSAEPVLERLAAGPGDPLLVVDLLQFTGAIELSAVIAAASNGRAVDRADPVADLASRRSYQPLDALADGYARAWLRGVAGPQVTVVGYCSAAALAVLIAARLAPAAEVTTVLVEPMWPDDEMVSAGFAAIRATLGAREGSGPDLGAEPAVALAAMDQALGADLAAAARARGLDEAGAAYQDLLGRYRAWLGFLLASRETLRQGLAPPVQAHVLTQAQAGSTAKVAELVLSIGERRAAPRSG